VGAFADERIPAESGDDRAAQVQPRKPNATPCDVADLRRKTIVNRRVTFGARHRRKVVAERVGQQAKTVRLVVARDTRPTPEKAVSRRSAVKTHAPRFTLQFMTRQVELEPIRTRSGSSISTVGVSQEPPRHAAARARLPMSVFGWFGPSSGLSAATVTLCRLGNSGLALRLVAAGVCTGVRQGVDAAARTTGVPALRRLCDVPRADAERVIAGVRPTTCCEGVPGRSGLSTQAAPARHAGSWLNMRASETEDAMCGWSIDREAPMWRLARGPIPGCPAARRRDTGPHPERPALFAAGGRWHPRPSAHTHHVDRPCGPGGCGERQRAVRVSGSGLLLGGLMVGGEDLVGGVR
jgi:hypothetical protein